MIFVIATIELVEGRRDEFLWAFNELIPEVRKEPGCIEYGPTVDLETNIPSQGPMRENVITVIEKWESIEALEEHLVAPHMFEYRKKAQDVVVKTTLQVLEPA